MEQIRLGEEGRRAPCHAIRLEGLLEAGGIAEIAKKVNPALKVIARAHSKDEVKHLLAHGADRVIMGEEEIARQLVLAAS